MLYIVDGTGEADDAEYARSMAPGFCKQLERFGGGQYFRGPALSGTTTFDIAKNVLSSLTKEVSASPGQPIYLAGHSRGGAAVIYVAQELAKLKIGVKAMFLFDAVDRTINRKDVQAIPGNVSSCYHARRDRKLADYYSAGVKMAQDAYDRCIASSAGNEMQCYDQRRKLSLISEQDVKMKMVMRATNSFSNFLYVSIDFGNCGTSAEPGCTYEEEFFLGSHGAIGGSPIVDESAPTLLIDSDRAAIASVKAWMFARLSQEKVFTKSVS